MTTAVDYRTDADVVWCKGCGDFGVMRSLADALAALDIPREEVVMVSGIGCSSRMPGYFEVYGFNTVHGRALPIAQGVKIARPELTVIVASGDGDALAIGAGHFMHAGRRNTDITMVLMDNQVYGLTKGQPSPTTPTGDEMPLASYGVQEQPIEPVALAIHCGATFVARVFSGDPKHLRSLLERAITHRGFAVVQVLTPCVTFRGGNKPFQAIKQRRAYLPDDHDSANKLEAITRATDEQHINLGVFYQRLDAPTFGDLMDRIATRANGAPPKAVEEILSDFAE